MATDWTYHGTLVYVDLRRRRQIGEKEVKGMLTDFEKYMMMNCCERSSSSISDRSVCLVDLP